MLSVFLVDDEPIIIRGLKKLIDWEQHGFQIVGEARDGEEALEKITTRNTDIVITDLKMPNMDGIELCERLREKIPGLRVIVLTAYDDFNYLQQSIRNGVADYILKPVKEKVLLDSLMKMKEDIEQNRCAYPFDLENRLIEATFQNSFPKVQEILQELLDCMEKNKIAMTMCKKISIGILTFLNHRLEQDGTRIADILRKDVLQNEFFCSFTEPGQLNQELTKIFEKIIEHRNQNKENELIVCIKRHVEKNMDKDISLNVVAKQFYINPSYLSQVFKKYEGKNYSNYVLELRMSKAQRLLADEGFRIQEISEIVGYVDWRYFSQSFKKYTGMTPSEYRTNLIK